MPGDDSTETSSTEIPQPATDAAGRNCRTAPLVATFSTCLVKNPVCKKALSFGHRFFCTHPRHREFVETLQPAAAGETVAPAGPEVEKP